MERDILGTALSEFCSYLGVIIDAIEEEDEEKVLKISRDFAYFFGGFLVKLKVYEAVLEQIANKSTSLSNKAFIARVLAGDDSKEVEAFEGFINKNKL